MSKCDFEIEFDRPDRVYYSGDVVKGVVRIQVNQDVHCRGLKILGSWKTHGRGNRASADYYNTNVYQGDLVAGQIYEFEFEFEAGSHPWTYHGHHLNIDHYVSVRIDVPWAFDPKYETEFVVLPSPSSSLPEANTDPATNVANRTGRVVGTIIGVVFVVIGIPLTFAFGFGCIFVGVGIAILFFSYRNLLAERKIGHVDFRIEPARVAPGGWLNVHLSFVPRGSGTLNRVLLTLLGQEIVISGSGTNRTTHTHKLHQDEVWGLSDKKFRPGEAVTLTERIQVPELEAYSTTLSDNKLSWTISARLDIPRWPDWLDSREFVLAPAVCLNESSSFPATQVPPVISQSSGRPVDETENAGGAPTSPWDAGEPVPAVSLEPDPWSSEPQEDSPPARLDEVRPAAGGAEFTSTELVGLSNQLAEADRFGDTRQQLIDAQQGRQFQAEIIVERTSYTYGVFDEAEYRSGQTLSGTLAGSNQRISIQLPESENERVSNARTGDAWKVQGRVMKWDDLYHRIELRGTSLG